MDKRAVSNTLGFVLLFAVVLSSIGIVGTVGVEQLTDARDGTITLNAEHTMTGVASAVDDVHSENVSRTSRVELGSGSLAAGEPTDITVDVGGGPVTETAEPIVYRAGDTRIIYVAGAVFRLEDEGKVVISEPDYEVPGSNEMVISLPITEAEDPDQVVSGTSAQVFLAPDYGSTTVETGSSVTVRFDTPSKRQAELWETALEDQFDTCGTPIAGDDTIVECDNSDSVLFRTTTTGFELNS